MIIGWNSLNGASAQPTNECLKAATTWWNWNCERDLLSAVGPFFLFPLWRHIFTHEYIFFFLCHRRHNSYLIASVQTKQRLIQANSRSLVFYMFLFLFIAVAMSTHNSILWKEQWIEIGSVVIHTIDCILHINWSWILIERKWLFKYWCVWAVKKVHEWRAKWKQTGKRLTRDKISIFVINVRS